MAPPVPLQSIDPGDTRHLIRDGGPSAYPMVRPMKSALHFDSADGFGRWRILISTRADKYLRQARTRDRETFRIVIKKIKELSNGHFSDDNQKRLNGQDHGVPIFEAKMTGDTRLVYQVDSVLDYDSPVELQVLRIFGIYTHTQLSRRLWKSIGQQLGQKGREYRRRCIYRERPVNPGDNVFFPASFPPIEAEGPMPVSDGLDLPPDDLEEIHSILVLEKYLTFSQELLHSIFADLDVVFPFQLSPQEKSIVEHPHSCYVLGRSGTGKTTTMLFKMLWIERTHQLNRENVAKPRQVFVTKSRVLAGKVEEYFLKLLNSLKIASQSPQALKKLVEAKKSNSDTGLVDQDDDENWRSDLPARFSELQDSHFPLFTTFDRLCDLIEGDFNSSETLYNRWQNGTPRTFVSFDHFRANYWPHFSQALTKGLDPAMVFSEIIGIIKGSEDTLSSPYRYLDRKVYQQLSERTQYTFATQRSAVYSIFEAYQGRKRQQGDFDAADRTHGILRVFQTPGHDIKGQKIDQLCVDEAQDNLLIDALLLRTMSCNPDGLFWAGDTAQTISVGSSFRFDDLKAFLFRVETRRMEKTSIMNRAYSPPKAFQLAANYRSHAGIVNCAQSVIEIISHFWPYSIDTLAPEKGIVDGLKPVFLNGWGSDSDDVRYEQFLFGSSGSPIEFGAQQCILVRDDHALQKLYGQVGDIGLIMTLYDSKGLEFNDVLLYDFFEDSPVLSSQWRLLLSADVMDQNSSVAPHFNEIRHASICAELKFLYVAITRARKNLWIADQSEKGEPMRLFWTGRDQIHNCTPGSDMPQLAVASSREEWESKGKELFERKKYLQAKHCYERAAMAHHMAISDAYYLRDQARKAPVGDSRQTKSQRDTAFLTAANAFLTCAKEAPKNSLVYFRRTAECFEAGKDDLRAAETYLDFVHDYDTAATIFRKLGLFDKAISVIDTYEHHMEKDLVNNIKVVARLYYFREEKLDKARHLFATDEEELEYLEDLDLDVARAEVLVSLGRRGEAAELHISEGRRFEAIPLFLEDRQKPDSMLRAAQCILSEMWCHTTFDTLPEQGQALSKLLEWSTHVRVEVINDKDQNELSMFKAIVLHDTLELARLSSIFLYAGNTRAAILCLNHYFREFPVVATLSGQGLAKILQLFLTYIWILHDLVYRSLDPSTEALFGIERISTGEYFLPGGTFLHHNLGLLWSSRKRSAEAGSSINGFNLDRLLKQAIFAHLRRKISEQNIVCRHAPQFFPCISFLALGYCNREQCPQGHATPTLELYNTHVRLHLQQIQIIQISVFVGSITGGEISLRKRQCINQLYEALNPPWHHLTQSLLREDLIPEFSKSIIILKDWLRAFAHTLNFRLSPAIFLTQMLCATRLSLALDKQNALFYIYHSPYLQAQPVQYLQPNGSYILHDLLSSLVGEGVSSLSAGILALKHILGRGLPIDINILCDYVEYLCASLLISYQLQRQGSFHGIVLPRSWLLRFDKKPEQAIKRETHISYLLIEPLRKLLEIIHTGAGADVLLFENLNLSRIPRARGIFIARICRTLCLLGYNTRNLRVDIFNSIRSLYRADVNFPAIYRQYVLARNWDELSRALRDTRRSVLVDELVQMHDLARGPVFYRAEFGVRVVPYKGYGDIARALGMPAPAVAAAEAQNANEELSAIATVAPEGHDAPVVVLSKSPVVGNEAEADMDSPHDIHVFDADEEEEVNLETSPPVASQAPRSTEHLAAAVIQRAYRRAVLQRQTRAVIVIQQAYRRILSRRQGVPKTRLSGKFSACLEIAHDASLKAKENRHYCQHILGPLPHILLCLDVGLTSAKSQKAIAKKLFQTARHETLGEVGERMTELSRLLKVLTQAQKLLEPSSDVHGRCNIVELRRLVKETAEHLKNLPFEVPDSGGFHDDLDIAVKGIVAEKKPPKARSKPALVWDEDGDQ